jgi:DNA-binding MarR family transcriptional regulator
MRPASVAFLLSQLGWATATRFRETLAPLGLEPRQFATLRVLGAMEGQSQQSVCAAAHIPPSRMVGLVDDLEARGLVERRLNAEDRRARAIHLTQAGRDLLGEAFARIAANERWISTPFSPQERQQLLALLARLAEHFALPATTHPDLTTTSAQPWPEAPPLPHSAPAAD